MTFISYIKNLAKTINTKTEILRKQKSEELQQIEKLYDVVDNIKNDKIETRFELKSIFIFWLVGAVVAYFSYIFFQSLAFVYLILTAYIVSIAMESIIEALQQRIPRWLAIIISYILMIAVLLSGFLLIVPFIVNQSSDIIKLVLERVNSFQTMLQTQGLDKVINDSWLIPWYFKQPIIQSLKNPEVYATVQSAVQQNISQIVSFWTSYVKNVWWIVVTAVSGFFSIIFNIILVVTMAIFFSFEKDWVINFIAAISWRKEFMRRKLNRLYKKLGFRLKWQLMLCLFIGLTVWVLLLTLSLFGIKLPNILTLALIAWLTEFIPYIGPILWAVPWVLVWTTSYGFTWLIAVLLVYWLVQWSENNILVPLVMNQALWVSPLVIFIAMIIGWSVLWFLWVLLSVPIAVIVTLIFEDLMKKS